MINDDNLVYEAERVIYYRCFPTRMASIEQVREYLAHLNSSKFVTRRWPHMIDRPIKVLHSKKYEWAKTWTELNKIKLPTWAFTDFVIIHENAHFLAEEETTEDHGPLFCGALLSTTEHFVSKEAGESLKHSFLSHGITYELPTVKR